MLSSWPNIQLSGGSVPASLEAEIWSDTDTDIRYRANPLLAIRQNVMNSMHQKV